MSRQASEPGRENALGRLKVGPDNRLIQTANRLEISYAPALYEGMSLADLAHVIVLMEAGTIPHAAGCELLAALLEAHATPVHDLPLDPAWGDVYNNRERYVSQHVPGAVRPARPDRWR